MAAAFGSLSEDLLHQVFSYLPFVDFIRGRCVCRSWLSALTSPAFFLLWSQRSSPSLWLLHCRSPSSLLAFHTDTHLLLPIPLPPLASHLIGSSHGILCFFDPLSFSLINPLSRQSIEISSPFFIHPPVPFGFVFLPAPLNCFHIIASACSGPQIHFQLYHSATRSWFPLPAPPHLLQPADKFFLRTQHFVWWNGKFCILFAGRVVIYDVLASQWSTVYLPTQPRIWDARYMTLHVIQGRLFVEGNFQEQGDFQRRYPLTVGILELDPEPLRWRVAAFMPKDYARLLCGNDYIPHPAHSLYTSFSDAECDHLCFTSYAAVDKVHLVFYHVKKNDWTSMDVDGKFRQYTIKPSSFKHFTFQPNFAALL